MLPQIELKDNEVLAEESRSVCPECLKVIDCQILFREDKVYLRKYCKDHGLFEVLVYSDAGDYLHAAKYNKPGSKPLHYQGSVAKGCPEDCGLCTAHLQHTCVGIIEITDMCNLNCPVCFADVRNSFVLTFELVKDMIDLYVKCEGKPEVLQISGGEPTLHPDILKILRYAGEKGILHPVLNTNGLKLADRDFAEKISQSMQDGTLPHRKPNIYLQFDGLSDDTYIALRGKPLIDLKMRALANCKEFGMNVSLVPTIVKGINEHEIGPIIDLALSEEYIKMVNFQPATLCGRYGMPEKHNIRMTIPDILGEIERQTFGSLKKKSFINIPCPYPTCSAITYVLMNGKKKIVLTELLNMDKYIKYIINHALPDKEFTRELEKALTALGSLLSMSSVSGSRKTEKAICTLCNMTIPDIGEFIGNTTIISVHAFMDEHNFDLKRAMKCCVTEILPNGQMIPFCVYNILYRKNLTRGFGNNNGRKGNKESC